MYIIDLKNDKRVTVFPSMNFKIFCNYLTYDGSTLNNNKLIFKFDFRLFVR